MREDIQALLNELTDIEVSAEVSDTMLEDGITYFSFSLNEQNIGSDFENNLTNVVNITGYVSRKTRTDENTLQIVDKATKDIIKKLKEFNIRCSYQDVTMLDNICKMRIVGKATYNEINNILV